MAIETFESAEYMVKFLSHYIGKKVVITDDGKMYDFNRKLASAVVPKEYVWVPGMRLDNSDDATLVAVSHLALDDIGFEIICVLAIGQQAYVFMWEGIQIQDVQPQNHGCWYCNTLDNSVVFSGEFDTNLHLGCLKMRLQLHPDDVEAKIFEREFREELYHDVR
jgi:hypothetical protein